MPYVNEPVKVTVKTQREISALENKAETMRAAGASEDEIKNMFLDFYAKRGIGAVTTAAGEKTIETPSERATRQQKDIEDFKNKQEQLKKDVEQLEKNREDPKSTRLNSSHIPLSRMPSSA